MTTFHISFYALTHLSHIIHSKLHFYYLKHFEVCLNYTNYIISKGNAAAILLLSYVQLFWTTWTVVCQAPLSMGYSRQEYRSGLPFPPPGDLPNGGIKSESPA